MSASDSQQSYLDQVEVVKSEVGKQDVDFLNAWSALSQQANKAGVLSMKQKRLIAIALSIAARCGFCIASHVKKAIEQGATREEIMEASFVAVSMGGGPSFTFLSQVIEACDEFGAA